MKAPKRVPKHDHERHVRTALERWVERDRKCRALHRAVRSAETDLKRALTKEGWALYLTLEEHINARHVEIVGAAIRLARSPRTLRPKKKY
jgi:hypothetical protein